MERKYFFHGGEKPKKAGVMLRGPDVTEYSAAARPALPASLTDLPH